MITLKINQNIKEIYAEGSEIPIFKERRWDLEEEFG